MTVVRAEVQVKGRWVPVGTVTRDTPLGSMSDTGARREVFVFGFIDGVPGVWRSTGGIDVERGTERAIFGTGLERLADLTEGPYEREVDRRGRRVRVRWSVA